MQSTIDLNQAPVGAPPAGRDSAGSADCVKDLEIHSLHLTSFMAVTELKRLRRMRQIRKPKCAIKLAKFWKKLHSRTMRSEWIRARRHWFAGATCFESIVEAGLKKFIEKENTVKDRFIDWDDDVNALKVAANGGTFEASQLGMESNVA